MERSLTDTRDPRSRLHRFQINRMMRSDISLPCLWGSGFKSHRDGITDEKQVPFVIVCWFLMWGQYIGTDNNTDDKYQDKHKEYEERSFHIFINSVSDLTHK